MAMSRQASTTSLLGGTTRFSSKTQNQNDGVDGHIARPGLGKPRLTSGKIRSTLGNISNNSSVAVDSRKVVRDDTFVKPLKPAMRYMATRSSTDKENVSSRKVQEKVEKPVPLSVSPMDTSSPPKVALPSHIDDIDRDDKNNPQLVSDYVNDIYDYLRKLEDQFAIKPKYLEGQAINSRMRAILIDWLVQVHLRFHLLQETLYLTVAIIDRFLQEQEVGRSKLQLVGVTAMLIASKYEEMYAPEINDFVYITDNAYKKKDICVMERLILRTLSYNLGRPLPLHFLRRNSKAGEVDANKHTLAKYLTELTITDYDMVQTKPSEIAAASLCLSVKLFDNSEWNDTLQHYSTYTEEQLRPTMARLANLVTRAGTGKLTTIKTKYSSSKFMRIALIPELKSALITELAETSRQ